jgi:hypothetical protein
VCLVPLAGIGAASFAKSMRRNAALVLVAAAVLGVVENLAATDVAPVPTSARTGWTAWLRDQPADTVVAHIPFAPGFRTVDFEPETLRMFAQIDHHRPLVNGYSGYLPTEKLPDGTVVQSYLEFLGAMRYDFPSEHLVCILAKNLGTDVLVFDDEWITKQSPDEMAKIEPFLEPAYRDASVRIFRVRIPDGACRRTSGG